LSTIYLKLELSFVQEDYTGTPVVQTDTTQTFGGATFHNVYVYGVENVSWYHYDLNSGRYITTNTSGIPFPYLQVIPENPAFLTEGPGPTNGTTLSLFAVGTIEGSSTDSSVLQTIAPQITFTTSYPDEYDPIYHVGNDTYSLSIPEFIWGTFDVPVLFTTSADTVNFNNLTSMS
jgi:hypothetical protein